MGRILGIVGFVGVVCVFVLVGCVNPQGTDRHQTLSVGQAERGTSETGYVKPRLGPSGRRDRGVTKSGPVEAQALPDSAEPATYDAPHSILESHRWMSD